MLEERSKTERLVFGIVDNFQPVGSIVLLRSITFFNAKCLELFVPFVLGQLLFWGEDLKNKSLEEIKRIKRRSSTIN